MSRSDPNSASASALESSVLPTPVGPRNRNDPIGRFGSCSPTLPLRIARATARTASSCPMTRLCSVSSSRSSLSLSFSVSCVTGTFAQVEITCATSFSVTTGLSVSARFAAASRCRFSLRSSLSCSNRAFFADSRSPFFTCSAIARSRSRICPSSFCTVSSAFDPASRTAAQASSMTSMALSGRFRSLIYRVLRRTAASMASSEMVTP